MSRVRCYAGLAVMAAGFLVAAGSLQYLLHVGSCGNGPNSLANGAPACPGGTWWIPLVGVAGLLLGVGMTQVLEGPATALAFGLGFTMLGAMFAVLGFVPAPGDRATPLGLYIGAPFLLGGLVAFTLAARSFVSFVRV